MSKHRRRPGIVWRTRGHRRRETDEEIRAHIEMRTDDLILKGMSPEEARREAEARFGELSRARADIEAAARRRDRRLDWVEWMDGVRRDLVGDRASDPILSGTRAPDRHDLRLRDRPYDRHVFARRPRAASPAALSRVRSARRACTPCRRTRADFPWVSMGNWYDWRENNRTLESAALHSLPRDATISTGDGAFGTPAVYVAGAFFETLRPPIVAGVPHWRRPASRGRAAAVVSEGFWRRVLGARPLDWSDHRRGWTSERGRAVLRTGYEHPEGVEVWMPVAYRAETGRVRNNINYQAIGRLSPGVTHRGGGPGPVGDRGRDPISRPRRDLLLGRRGAAPSGHGRGWCRRVSRDADGGGRARAARRLREPGGARVRARERACGRGRDAPVDRCDPA